MLKVEFESLDQLAERMDWQLDMRQLDRGTMRPRAREHATGSIHRVDYQFSLAVDQQGVAPESGLSFGIQWGKSKATVCGEVAHAGILLGFNNRSGFEAVSRAGFHGTTLTVDKERLEATLFKLNAVEALEEYATYSGVIKASRENLTAFVTTLSHQANLQSTWTNERGQFLREAELYTALANCLSSGNTTKVARLSVRRKAVRRARDFIAENARDTNTLADVCRESAVSERTLIRAFNEEFGISPGQYIKMARLHGVRRLLEHSSERLLVHEAAESWGFWHMSQFAKDYGSWFGELPLQTQARCLARTEGVSDGGRHRSCGVSVTPAISR